MYISLRVKDGKFNTTLFKQVCKRSDIETGRYNELDHYIDPLIEIDELDVATGLFSLFQEIKNEPYTNHIFLGILYCVKMIKDEQHQQLLSLITSRGASNDDPVICEMAIRCYEQWDSKFALSHIKMIDEPKAKWIKEYKDCVTKELEEKYKDS